MDKKKIAEALEELKSCFSEVSHLARDNCPDADEDAMEEFESDMNDAEKDFDKAFETVRAALADM